MEELALIGNKTPFESPGSWVIVAITVVTVTVLVIIWSDSEAENVVT